MFIAIILCIGLVFSACTSQSQTSAGCWPSVLAPLLLCELDSSTPCPLRPDLWPDFTIYVDSNDCLYNGYLTDISYMCDIADEEILKLSYGGNESDCHCLVEYVEPADWSFGENELGHAIYTIVGGWRFENSHIYINYKGRNSNNELLFPGYGQDGYNELHSKVLRHELAHILLFAADNVTVGFHGDGFMLPQSQMLATYGTIEMNAMKCAYGDWMYNSYTDDGLKILDYVGSNVSIELPEMESSGISRVSIEAFYANRWVEVGFIDDWSEGIENVQVGSGHQLLRAVQYYVNRSPNKTGPTFPADETKAVEVFSTVKSNVTAEMKTYPPARDVLLLGEFVNMPVIDQYVAMIANKYNLSTVRHYLPPGISRDIIKDLIHDYYISHSIKYVLILGDANDYECFDPASDMYDEVWVTDQDMCMYQIMVESQAYPEGEPSWDIVPTWYSHSYRELPCYGLEHTPLYSATDIPYVDFDDNGVPDIPIARIPAHSSQEIDLFVNKALSYHNRTDDQDIIVLRQYHDSNNGAPSYFDAVEDIIAYYFLMNNLFNINANIFTINNHERIGQAWDRIIPEYYMMVSAGGYNREIGHILNEWTGGNEPPLDLKKEVICHTALLTCFGASFAYSRSDETVCDRLLFDNDGGAITVIGPTGISLYEASKKYALGIAERLEKGKFMVDTFYETMVNILNDDGIADEIKASARTYCLLGDPFSLLSNSSYNNGIVSVNDVKGPQTLEVLPNPANSSVTLKLHTIRDGDYTIDIYDIMGRRVCASINCNVSNGIGQVVWRGVNSNGEKAPSGVYISTVYFGEDLIANKQIMLVN